MATSAPRTSGAYTVAGSAFRSRSSTSRRASSPALVGLKIGGEWGRSRRLGAAMFGHAASGLRLGSSKGGKMVATRRDGGRRPLCARPPASLARSGRATRRRSLASSSRPVARARLRPGVAFAALAAAVAAAGNSRARAPLELERGLVGQSRAASSGFAGARQRLGGRRSGVPPCPVASAARRVPRDTGRVRDPSNVLWLSFRTITRVSQPGPRERSVCVTRATLEPVWRAGCGRARRAARRPCPQRSASTSWRGSSRG